MIEYPFQVPIDGKSLKIRDTVHFIADYDQDITAKANHALKGQNYEMVFANWQGAIVGEVELWFSDLDNADAIKSPPYQRRIVSS